MNFIQLKFIRLDCTSGLFDKNYFSKRIAINIETVERKQSMLLYSCDILTFSGKLVFARDLFWKTRSRLARFSPDMLRDVLLYFWNKRSIKIPPWMLLDDGKT